MPEPDTAALVETVEHGIWIVEDDGKACSDAQVALDALAQRLAEAERDRDGFFNLCRENEATADAAEARATRAEEALREAHGILQYNLGDVDPHVRSACDIMWAALTPTEEPEQ